MNASKEHTITINSLPPGIVERCKLEPKILIELMRSELWKREEMAAKDVIFASNKQDLNGDKPRHEWINHIHDCPQGIVNMLNSRACRSAIMFNDEMSKEQ